MKYGELLISWRDTLMSEEPPKNRLVRLREIEAELPRFAKGQVICNEFDTYTIASITQFGRETKYFYYTVKYEDGRESWWIDEAILLSHGFVVKEGVK